MILPDRSTLLDALAAAGGVGANAHIKSVRVIRGEDERSFDCVRVLKTNPDEAPELKDGDAISIAEDMIGLPHFDYFNRLLFEWAYLKGAGKKVGPTWKTQVQHLTASGQKERRA